MGEKNVFEFKSSQDELQLPSSQETSYPLSQETFAVLWNDLLLANSPNGVLFNDVSLNNAFNDSSNVPPVAADENIHGSLQLNNPVAACPSVPLTSQNEVTNSSHGTSSLPACENWPGDYNFKVYFCPQNKDTKGVAWTYSEIKDKLYVGKDTPCPVNFSVDGPLPYDNINIRAMALYSSPEQVSEIVRRCVNHSMEEITNGLTEAEHLVRCESSTAAYRSDAITGRHSVLVPFEIPAAGQKYSTYIYKFACFGSCSGGPNRRPLMLIFTLESGNQVIGRRKIDLKICACPGRDRKSDEAQCMPIETVRTVKRKSPNELVNLSEAMGFVTKNVYLPSPKKSKASPNEDGDYTINVGKDKECYDFLRNMKKLYDMCKFMKGVPPDHFTKTNFALKMEKSD